MNVSKTDRLVPLKHWLHEQAKLLGISPAAVYARNKVRGWRGVKRKWINARVVLVNTNNQQQRSKNETKK